MRDIEIVQCVTRGQLLQRMYAVALWLACGFVAAIMPLAAQAQTYLSPIAPFTGSSGPTGTAVFTYPGQNITATIRVNSPAINNYSMRDTAANGNGAFGTQTLGSLGAAQNTMFTGATTATPAVLLDSGGFGCNEALNVEQNCINRGTVTVTFSQPVTNPRLHFGGLGARPGGLITARFTTFYTLTASSPAGVSMTRLSGNPPFSGSTTTVSNSAAIDTVNTSCALNEAACGSVQVVGSNITSLTFSANVRQLRTAGAWPDTTATGIFDGHTFSVSIAPIADLAITKTNTPAAGPSDQAGDTVVSGDTTMAYRIVVRNAGPNSANGTVLTDPAPTGSTCTTVTCTQTGGAVCPAVTVAALQTAGVTIATFPAGGALTLALGCTVN